jgi:hypothetical protein
MGKVCLEKESGGLRVRRVKEFNLSLLGKWCWRLFNEPKRLWCKVLKAKYGSRDGQVVSGVNKASSWWKDLISIMDGSAVGEDSWFGDSIKPNYYHSLWEPQMQRRIGYLCLHFCLRHSIWFSFSLLFLSSLT